MDKISLQQIRSYLNDNGIDAEVVQLKDTLGNQQLFRVHVKGKVDTKKQKEIQQVIQNKFHTKVTDIRFVNENLHYDYNGSHMLVYDIQKKYSNVYSGKVQMQIDDEIYGYEILFDDMKGIIEWDKDFSEINQDHIDDGTSRDFKGLIDMFNIGLQYRVNIDRHLKGGTDKKRRKKNKKGTPEILINFDQAKGLVSYISIKNLEMDNTSFNRMVQELTSQALYVRYDQREKEFKSPKELFIGRSGTRITDIDITNITRVLSKYGIDTSNYQYVNVKNLDLLPTSALIKTSIKNDQIRNV